MKTRFLPLALVLALLLALLPVSALAWDVGDIYISVPVPQDGQAPGDAVPTLSTDSVHIYAYDWKDSKGDRMTSFDSFRQGESYTVVVVVSSSGTFTDKAKVLVNGEPVAWEFFGDNANSVRFTKQFTATAKKVIDAFAVSVKEPAVGEHASLDVTVTGADLVVKEVYWTYGTTAELDDTHIFEAGPSYTMWISVAPADPSAHFREYDSGWPDVHITCPQAEVYNPQYSAYHPDWLHFGLVFGKLDAQTVPALSFTGVTAPAEGVKPAYDVTPAGEHYSLTANEDNGFHAGVRWFDLTTGAPAARTESSILLPFQSGHQYRLDLEVKPDDGWAFDPAATTATVNGQSAVLEGNKTRVTVSYTFPALKENQVIDSIDLTVPAPEIGEKAAYTVGIAGAGLHQAAVNDSDTQDGVRWYRDDMAMVPGAIFGYEFCYAVEVTVECDSGYEFASSGGKYTAAATVNGESAEVALKNDGKRAVVAFAFPKIDRVLAYIEIEEAPDRTLYKAGESFDPSGMLVLAWYTDGLAMSAEGCTCTPAVLSMGDSFVTVSYTEGNITRTAQQPVTVVKELKQLKSIAVTAQPAKTVYFAGESFAPDGMTVIATYSDGSTAEIIDYTYTPAVLSEGDKAVVISYTEDETTRTAAVDVTVKPARTLESIAVTTPPVKTEYKAGETFQNLGMVITATYTDKTTAAVTGYSISPALMAEGVGSVTVSYSENGVTKTAAVAVTVAPAEKENEKKANPFKDVFETDYYYDAVLWAYYATPQVTNGVSADEFAPKSTVTRGQAVTFLWRAVGCPEPAAKANPFADVTENAWYYKAVLWAVEKGVTKGTDDSHFTPDQTCSTAHILTFLFRALGVGSDGWYTVAEAWAKGAGLLEGLDIAVAPGVDCPRADVVLFLYRAVGE